ncbi:hypothetical protein N7493_001648 [Penicillium malachiteum]|uniref:DUF6604 domain-containing protein n=1 Tax=Penicillium malachiteum TaxID=1324776 RepID=A0AAD6HUZ4_9EURO|nr:hypothetical protein N7493_001648 [Penicillium malachiteum]
MDNKVETGGGDGEETDDGNEGSANELPTLVHKAATQRKRKPSNRGKKGKQGRKTKTKGAKMESTSALKVRTVSQESYGIIEDESGKTAIHYMATYSMMHQWLILRHHLQSVWRAVAYNELNTAAASSLCNVAIEMIKDSQSQIFVEFPGHADGVIETSQESSLDMKEELLIHTFQHPCDFVMNYRKNGSGKPTKGMLKSIKNWDPHCDFSKMSKEERLQRRRSFTINWLYDLVNLFAFYVMESLTMEEEGIQPKTVEWSKSR